MELIDLENAIKRLGISESYFRQTLRAIGLKPIRHDKFAYYTTEHLQAVRDELERRRRLVRSPFLMKIIKILENVPAGYTATKEGICRYINRPTSTMDNMLANLDTVYEEKITPRLTIMGLTDNHIFLTEETTPEEDEEIKSYCISNAELKKIRVSLNCPSGR